MCEDDAGEACAGATNIKTAQRCLGETSAVGSGGAPLSCPDNDEQEPVSLKSGRGDINGTLAEIEAVHKRLLAESLIVFHDKRTSSRQLATQVLVGQVGRLAVVQSADDIQTVIEKLHVPHPTRSGVDAVITDLDPKVPKLVEFLRARSLRPELGKLPIVPVIVVIDASDPRPEMLASALESGVGAILKRPLERSTITTCVGEILRRHAGIEFVYKDVVGEVETFNYPRFVLEGFQSLGFGEGSISAGDGDGGITEAMGGAVRMYTLQTSTSRNGSVAAVGSGGWIQDSSPPNGAPRSYSILPAPAEVPLANQATALLVPLEIAGGKEDGREKQLARGGWNVGSPGSPCSGMAAKLLGKAKVVTILNGGHVKLSSPSRRPRLYLNPGDKGYIGSGVANGAATGEMGVSDGDVVDSERQVSHELTPFVKRKAPALGDPFTSSGLSKARLARTMRLVENTYSFTRGQDVKTAWQSKGRNAVDPRTVCISSASTVGPDGKVSSSDPSTDGIDRSREEGKGDCWRSAPRRAPRPDDKNPLAQKRVFSSTGTQGRRAAMRPGMFDEVDRSKHANINPTASATTAGLRGALGVVAMGDAAAKAVIGRMMRNRKKRLACRRPSTTGGRKSTGNNRNRNAKDRARLDGFTPGAVNSAGGVKRESSLLRRNSRSPAGVKSGGNSSSNSNAYSRGSSSRLGQNGVRGGRQGGLGVGQRRGKIGRRGEAGVVAGGFEESVFKAVLSSMANNRLRSGLQEIQSNPRDLLRCEFVDNEPSRHGSTALGCHLMKGWVELKAGNQRRALDHYRRAVASEPENVEALFCKAVISARLGEFFDALKDFSAAISFSVAEAPCAERSSGSTARGSGTLGTAAHDGGVTLASLYFNRALVHVCLGDDTSALDDLDRAVTRATRNITYRSNRALILRRTGDFRGAQQDYSRIRALQALQQASVAQEVVKGLGTEAITPRPATAPVKPVAALQLLATDGEQKVSDKTQKDNNSPGRRQLEQHGTDKTTCNIEPFERSLEGSPTVAGRHDVEGSARGGPGGDISGPNTRNDCRGATCGTVDQADEGSNSLVRSEECEQDHLSVYTATGRTSGHPSVHAKPAEQKELTAASLTATDRAVPKPVTTCHHVDGANPTDRSTKIKESLEGRVDSPLYRDKRLLEDSDRRKALLQQLLASSDACTGVASADVSEGKAMNTSVAAATSRGKGGDGKRTAGRERSSAVASLGEFKASIGLSSKGELFDDLFCRPSLLDEALTAEPGQRTPDQLSSIVEAIEPSPSLKGLQKSTLMEMANALEYRVLERMSTAFCQGEETDAMAIILSGRIAVKLRRADLSAVSTDELGPGDTFGEACMLDERRLSRRSPAHPHVPNINVCQEGRGADAGLGGEEHVVVGGGRNGRPGGPEMVRGGAVQAPLPATVATAGKSMETYQTLEPTRLVLILKDDFYRMTGLRTHCCEALKRRHNAIKRCGLFIGWDAEDIMRLARMSRVHRHPSKSVLLMQRKEPSHLHVLLTGTCTVTKYPDRLAAVRRKITEIDAALYRINSKYAYHRDIRATPEGIAPKEHATDSANNNGTMTTRRPVSGGREEVAEGKKCLTRAGVGESFFSSHVTTTEVRKAELEREAKRWMRTLAHIRRKDGDVVDTSQIHKVAALQYPQFFGEMCLLVPDGGKALGTVSTNTMVETVSMSKYVLQTFHITDGFLQGIRQKASIYPEDINLAKVIEADRWWEGRRRELVLEALVGPASSTGGASGGALWKHKNEKLIRKRRKIPRTTRPTV